MKLFNESLTMRYATIERNIKSKSNSFYDSFLDLLEATIKYVLDENQIEYDPTRTCGHLIRNEKSIVTFFKERLKVDDNTFSKLSDYIKKCNDHKHKKEKQLGIESVINYLKIYYSLINYYCQYKDYNPYDYDPEYYVSIFGESERLNNQYKSELSKLHNDLQESYNANKLSEENVKKYESLLSMKEIELLNLDEQNKELQEQISILKDIKLSSMEVKLNKALEMLVNLNAEIQENRFATAAVYRSITGGNIKEAIEKLKEHNNVRE